MSQKGDVLQIRRTADFEALLQEAERLRNDPYPGHEKRTVMDALKAYIENNQTATQQSKILAKEK